MPINLDPAYCTCPGPNGPGTGWCDSTCLAEHLLANGKPLEQWLEPNASYTCVIRGFPIPFGVVDDEYTIDDKDPVMQYMWILASLGNWHYNTWYEIVDSPDDSQHLKASIEWFDPWGTKYEGDFTVTIERRYL